MDTIRLEKNQIIRMKNHFGEQGGKMGNQKEKGFRKLNRSQLGSVLIIYLIVSLVFNAFLAFFANMFLKYVVESRIYSEYKDLVYMTKLYEKQDVLGDIAVFLGEEDKEYFLADRDQNILYQRGENTCSKNGGTVRLSMLGKKVYLCEDREIRLLRRKSDGVTFDMPAFLEWTKQTNGLQKLADKGATLDIPFWIAEDVGFTNTRLYCKAYFSVDASDLIFLAAITVSILVMILGMSFMLIYHIVGSIVRQRKMTNLFFMDDVTGGRNWMWFMIKGEQLLQKPYTQRSNFAMINISFIKYRNFCMCHSIKEGEDILAKVDKLLVKDIEKNDLCAHNSSANFAVLMRFNNEEQLHSFLEKLLKDLEIVDGIHKFSFHIGVSIIREWHDVRKWWLLRRRMADLEKEYNNACTARETLADNDNSAIAFFDERMIQEQRWLDIVQENQQRALQDEEFVVFYQPKYDPKTDRLCGAEALIRWESPVYGFKGPDTIIPIFEKNGFITEIDTYMIRRVARDQKEWVDKGYACVPVSVNVSRAHFAESNLAQQIRDLVDAEQAPHELIEIELTESAFFDDKTALVSTIKKLKEFGFVVSMDDFGAGYSSLNSLKDMPLDVLKLDAEFFRGDSEDGRGEIVISEALQLAKKLHMRTVAEGVEAREQVDFLAEKGCDMIQGYYYSKPLPKSDFESRLKEEMQKVAAEKEEKEKEEKDKEEKAAGELKTDEETENGESPEEVKPEDRKNETAGTEEVKNEGASATEDKAESTEEPEAVKIRNEETKDGEPENAETESEEDKRREFEREEGKEAFLLKPDPEMAGQEQPDSP
ncbi:MAG: EAL domain-containing protein [Lachnospiraceae bacterium]|nr:EAL domain-containing protein [Lachnospiraceae bacterium]